MNRASLDHTVSAGPEWSKLAPIPKAQEEEKSCRRCMLVVGLFLVTFWGGFFGGLRWWLS